MNVEHNRPATGRQDDVAGTGAATLAPTRRPRSIQLWAGAVLGLVIALATALATVVSVESMAADSGAADNVAVDSGTDRLDATALRALDRALEAADSGQWPVARRHIDASGSPLLRTYIVWREFVAGNAAVDFERYDAFLRRYPDWPRLGAVRANAELRLDETVDHASRLRFFADRRPATRQGRIRLAQAEFAMGDAEQGLRLVRQSWLEDNFSQSEALFFLQNFGDLLETADHEARLDRLLWDGREGEARRMFRRVSPGWVALAEARLALQAMTPGVDGLIRRVPAELANDPGLAYDRLRWRRLKGRDDGVREILVDPPAELGRPWLWWHERAYQIRTALSDGDFATAYKLARGHGQTTGAAFAEAAWLVGWLALRHADDPESALGHFAAMYDAVSMPISRSRAAYWSGRAAADLGDSRAAARWYRLAGEHPTAYYGQAALEELGEPLRLTEVAARFNGATTPDAAFDGNARVRLVKLFCALEMADRAVPFLERLLLDVADKSRVMGLARACDRPDIVVELGKHGVSAGVVDPLVTFPIPAHHGLLYPIGNVVEPALSLAIGRQESHFDTTAASPVGALGLMQVMPATGKAIADRLGLAWSPTALQQDSHYNAQIGVHYLGMLAERFDGRLEMMAAAYNAGPPRVAEWVDRHGDPRTLDRHALIDWIELIPYRETRNYVQRIIESRTVYRELLREGLVQPVSVAFDTGPAIPPPMPMPKPSVY